LRYKIKGIQIYQHNSKYCRDRDRMVLDCTPVQSLTINIKDYKTLTTIVERSTRYNLMWSHVSVTSGKSLPFCENSGDRHHIVTDILFKVAIQLNISFLHSLVNDCAIMFVEVQNMKDYTITDLS
jgi:hypothetical protein